MKKLSVFLVLVMVISAFTFITADAASAVPRLVYEPAGVSWYRPGQNVTFTTVAEGSSLNFGWHVTVSTPEKDYKFDLSTNQGFKDFNAFDSGKMNAKVSTQTQSNGRTASTLTLENLKFYDYGVFVYCTVKNAAGSKTTDTVVVYPNDMAPPMPTFEQLAEINIRAGKLLKFACNVYAPEGQNYDNIEYQWYQSKNGSKDGAEALQDENYCVLVVDTSTPGTYYYYCVAYIIQNSIDYYYESCMAEITVYEPEIGVTYSKSDLTLDAGETAQIKANVTVTPASDRGELKYQWMSGDNNIPGTYTPVKGAMSDTITVKGADTAGKKYYCCIVTNTVDGFEFNNDSSEIPIAVVNSTGKSTPVVHMDPKDAYANPGDTVTFALDAENAAYYEWYMVEPGGTTDKPKTQKKLKNGADGVISGAETQILKIKASAELNGYMFFCRVYGSDGKYVSTKNAKLTVHLPMPVQPNIKKHPESVTAYFGDKVVLSVSAEATDGGKLKYQWYASDKPEYPTIKAVIGAEKETFTPEQSEAVKYYCVAVWNLLNGGENGPVYSDFAKVEFKETATDTETETASESVTEDGSETVAPDTESDTAADPGTVSGTETAAESESGKSGVESGAENTTEITENNSGKNDGGNNNKLVIILLVVIICLLAAALIGVIVFLIIKFSKGSKKPQQ